MNFKKIIKKIFYPHIVIMITLVLLSFILLVFSLIYFKNYKVVAYFSYVLSFYTLLIWCLRIPSIINYFKSLKEKNKYINKLSSDIVLRNNIVMYFTFFWNVTYALFQLSLGFINNSFWFFSLAIYYLCLALVRFYLVDYTRSNKIKDNLKDEFIHYRMCGFILLILNIIISIIIFFMVFLDKSILHHEIITVAIATYTFVTFGYAIYNIIKYRKVGSPVLSAGKAVRLAQALVSMLTLEATMLSTFGSDSLDITTKRIFLIITGTFVSTLIVFMAIYMIIRSNKTLRMLSEDENK